MSSDILDRSLERSQNLRDWAIYKTFNSIKINDKVFENNENLIPGEMKG